jgi:5-dehydro-2-deoxygluconokinase
MLMAGDRREMLMKNATLFESGRRLDVICLGRLGVDLYAQQIGSRLEDVSSFAKYLGGSSANIAANTARLGLKSAMLTRVGDDQMGRFLKETLAKEGCDVSHVIKDPQHLTALVLLGLKDRETFPLVFYRDNCADMALAVDDFDEAFIASSRSLLITGTHFSTAHVDDTSRRALEFARRNNVRTVLDIDYRPVLWGLTGKAQGEVRFVSSEGVTKHLRGILPLFDLIVGTEEEFKIAGGEEDLLATLRSVREVTTATLVVKLGALGCTVFEGEIPDSMDKVPTFGGVRVEVLNVLGAGDAFIAGFLSGWLRGENYEVCAARGNGCGALAVSRHGCSTAMPTPVELDYFLKEAAIDPERVRRPNQNTTLTHLHRVTVPRARWEELYVFAFDHRSQFAELARKAGAQISRIPVLKKLLIEAVAMLERDTAGYVGKLGILADETYGQDALNAATGRGWWIGRPVELPGSNPLQFEYGRSIGTSLISWPSEHVAKCLIFYHPDDSAEHRLEQEAQVRALYGATQVSGHELLLEIIPPRDRMQPDTVYRSLKRFYDLGIKPEWWKLESMTNAQWRSIDELIAERDLYCRGVLLLGLSAPVERLAEGFQEASGSTTCRGFAVGRTIFEKPSLAWLAGQIDDETLITRTRGTFENLITLWREARKSAPPKQTKPILEEIAV